MGGYRETCQTDIKFQKTGKEIQESIKNRIILLGAEIETRQAEMATICKNREVDLQEVLDAGEDAHRIETYSNKMSSNVGRVGTKTVLEALQKDLTFLRESTSYVYNNRKVIERLERVSRNLQSSVVYAALSYDELVLYGF